MVQGTPGATKYNGSMDAISKILKADGIRGLYRGFGMSMMTYAPSSAVWWAAYGSSQRLIWRSKNSFPLLVYAVYHNVFFCKHGPAFLSNNAHFNEQSLEAMSGFF